MQDQESRTAAAGEAFEGFVDGFQSLMIASIDAQGGPAASYAPFVRDEDGRFYIFVSLLAEHTRNLLDRPQASVMLIETEDQARQIFARRRVTYRCRVEEMAREAPESAVVLSAFHARFGAIMDLLGGLGDFRLLKLAPVEGRFVLGFGQAYRLGGARLEELEAIGPGEA